MASLIANGKQQYFNNAGAPLVGGKLWTYAAGSNIPKATYADADGLVQNTNPIILDGRGEALVFWAGSYKVTLKDALGNVIWTVDKVTETNLGYRTSSSGSAVIPSGTTAQRDAAPFPGYFRYNVDLGSYEGYYATVWASFMKSVNGSPIPDGGNVLLKTVGGVDLVGAGDVAVQAPLVSGVNIKTVNSQSVLGAGNLIISTGVANNVTNPTSSVTLTAATIGYHATQMIAIGQSITAPDATTLTVGGMKAIIDNTKGTYPVAFRDSTGVLIMAVAAGGEMVCSLRDNSTAAGVWSVTGTNLEPGIITIDSTFSSTYAATVLAPFVALDANTSIHFAALASGFAAFVVDNTGKVLSTPVTISSTASSVPKAVFKISATTALVFFGSSTTDHQAVVLTLTGASPTYSLSVGTPASLVATLLSSWGGADFIGAPKIAQLSATLYMSSFTGGAVTYCIAISVAGAVVTIGALTTVLAGASSGDGTTTYALTATTALVIYSNNAGQMSCAVVSVAGVVCTVNAASIISSNSTATAAPTASCQLTATKFLVLTSSATTSPTTVQLNLIVVAGTVVTVPAVVNVEPSSVTGADSAITPFTANGATRYNPHLFPLTATTALFWYVDSGGTSRAVVITEAASVLSANTILYNSISINISPNAGFGVILPQGTTEFLTVKSQLALAAGAGLTVESHKISGVNITHGASKPLRNVSQNSNGVNCIRLASSDYVIGSASYNAAFSVFRSNGDAINSRGDIAVPMLTNGAMLYQAGVVAANRFVYLGTTTQSGSTINGLYQLRLINVEIAA